MKRAVYASLICLFAIVFFTTVSMAQVEEMAIGKTFGVGGTNNGDGGCFTCPLGMISLPLLESCWHGTDPKVRVF